MALDAAILNIGEYYSSHYLDSTFSSDIKEKIKAWKELGTKSAPRKLQGLSREYFLAKNEAIEKPDILARDKKSDYIPGWHSKILSSLGYLLQLGEDFPVDAGKKHIPVALKLNRYNKPWLVICQTHFCLPDSNIQDGLPSEIPLEQQLQQKNLVDKEHKLCRGDWSHAIGKIFTVEEAPRWVMLLAGSQILLFDKHTWAQGRYLLFDLDDAFGRAQKSSFDEIAAFLSLETLCPEGESDEVLHDRLEEQSHRFAHGVTDKLQHSVREAIQLLANEWIRYRQINNLPIEKLLRRDKGFDQQQEVTAERLRHEALIFVYRLLFCFYAESRGGELGILPVLDEAYSLGYSLEALRDLEQVPLTPATEKGTYFHNHLRQLFKIIHQGFNHQEQQDTLEFEADNKAFSVRPLTATLFDPKSTPLLDNAELSNLCLQKVIARLSLSESSAKGRGIGRVNYAQLGINQLGAVYEGLLSFKGMFAKEDLIHVHRAKDDFSKAKDPSWFVPEERLAEFKKDEVERLEGGSHRVYPKGSFVLHLNGIDREQSASYYTPEVLTKCLVEETLRELLKDYKPADADRILSLKICEPAMGSGAFLNEATGQLAEKYLELKQQQLEKTIEPERYLDELRRVKHFIATRNVYGVDLNPTAVELGALSLWLGSIHRLLQQPGERGEKDIHRVGATPWFGLRLRAGNSLIGARRAVWSQSQLINGRHYGKDSEVPRQLGPGEERKENEVYHFLVFDEDMAPAHKDKLMKQFWKDDCGRIANWQKKEVKSKWSPEQVQDALEICDLIDKHWDTYTEQRQRALEKTACTASVWPTEANSPQAIALGPRLEDQEEVAAKLESSSGSFQRIKLLMDTWCALWFWPLEQSRQIPTREAFLAAAKIIVGDSIPDATNREMLNLRLDFDVDILYKVAGEELPNTDHMADAVPWLGIGHHIAGQQHFHHWELIFTEILGPGRQCHGGFDVIVGNPPWIKATWNDALLLSDFDPLLGVKDAKSAKYNKVRSSLLEQTQLKNVYRREMASSLGAVKYLNSANFYPALKGVQTNLYKNFIERTWAIQSPVGSAGLLHPDGIFDDPKSGKFRCKYYQKLRAHYHFRNQRQDVLFHEVAHREEYSINVFSQKETKAGFNCIFNLFLPETITKCRGHQNPAEAIPGIKNDEGKWDTRGHISRILNIDEKTLQLFADVFEERGTPALEARLPKVHSRELLSVLQKFAEAPQKLADLKGEYYATEMFHESNAQRDGIITRQDDPSFQPASPEEWVISGPHFNVGNPLYQTPHTQVRSKGSFEQVDLTEIPEDFLPRAVYRPGDSEGSVDKYLHSIHEFKGEKLTSHFHHINRKMVGSASERTLQSAIVIDKTSHMDACFSLTFLSDQKLINFNTCTSSICYDYYLKITGKTNCRHDVMGKLPYIEGFFDEFQKRRNLRLNSLTKYYKKLWCNNFKENDSSDSWTSDNPRLTNDLELPWDQLTPTWSWKSPLRTDFSRRQALLEIDVLVAMSLKMTLEELLTIYRVQFPVMRQYELADEYDNKGRRIPNTTRKDRGAKEVREARQDWDGTSPLTVSWLIDDGRQEVSKTFYPPFTKVDREADYEQAWQVFTERFKDQEEL